MITGFINPDTAQTQGIANQWIIPVPPTEKSYITDTTIRIRVYPSNGLNVTEWSNPLPFYNPPYQPNIFTARYDENTATYYDDDLWVLLNDVSGNELDLKYMLAFYYYNTASETVWKVSDLLDPEEVSYVVSGETINKIRLHCPLDGDVSTDPSSQIVYVAAHAVYEFNDGSSNYYTVSEISNTVEATPAEFTAPVLAPITYDFTNQYVTLNWLPPNSSFLPFYEVEKYNIYNYVNDASGSPVLLSEVSGNFLTFTYENTNLVCGTTLSYYVEAISATGAPSQQSNTQSIQVFTAAEKVDTLEVDWATYTSPPPSTDEVAVAFTFTNPTDLGCGAPTNFEWIIAQYSTSGSDVTPILPSVKQGTVTYVAGTVPYNVITTYVPVSSTNYKVFVRLFTTNPNTQLQVAGAWEDSGTIVAAGVPIIYNIQPFGATAYTGAGVTFNVASPVVIAPIAQVVYGPLNELINVEFNINLYIVGEVEYNVDIGVYVYTISFQWLQIGLLLTPFPFGLLIGNEAGVGAGIKE
jgi:hypothetical protein